MRSTLLFAALLVTITALVSCKKSSKQKPLAETEFKLQSPLGKNWTTPDPDSILVSKFHEAKAKFDEDPSLAENIIWYGRRTAYLGQYQEAINIFTSGIKKFPDDPRFYRHRGHRYITIRNYKAAIADLTHAAELIRGKENKIEPDGLPNALNIPVSTLHGNIWYHLGLAYYLEHEYERAFESFMNCRETGTNDDNLVSSTHWLYMISRRLGEEDSSRQLLDSINNDLNIIENYGYYDLCRFYKGLLTLDSLQAAQGGTPASDAVLYGLANWHFYNNKKDSAKVGFYSIIDKGGWNSFGYIAAESDILQYYPETVAD